MNATLARLIVRRLATGILSLFVVSVLVFSMVDFLPGDFASSILGMSATEESKGALERQLGLDKPPVARYMDWVGNVLHGNLGNSFTARAGLDRPVWEILRPRIQNTAFLAISSALVAIPLGIVLGLLAVRFRGSLFDRSVNAFNLVLVSMPEFVIGYALVMLLAINFPVFPSLSNVSPGMAFGEKLYRSVLPIMTMSLIMAAHIMRMTRTSVIGVMAAPYIEMATLKGMPEKRVIVHHALANAWGAIVNVVAFNLAYLVVGVVILESVFVYPGLGQAMVDAIKSRDMPVVQACALIFAGVYIVLNLLADIVTLATNPRLLYSR